MKTFAKQLIIILGLKGIPLSLLEKIKKSPVAHEHHTVPPARDKSQEMLEGIRPDEQKVPRPKADLPFQIRKTGIASLKDPEADNGTPAIPKVLQVMMW